MDEDPVAAARDLVVHLFPQARWALLTGSVLTFRRTPGSDLDVVVVLPDDDSSVPHRQSRYWHGWPVEVFVHDAATLAHYLAKELPQRRPVLHHMIATGVVLVGDLAQALEEQKRCAGVLAAGPPRLTDEERAAARYSLTDQLDDLAHAHDAGERIAVAVAAWVNAAQEALALGGRWVGAGKWLLRQLRDMDAGLAGRWLDAHGNIAATEAFVREVLDRAGGPLFAGYQARGARPANAGPGQASTDKELG
jgi:hypothetical protein